MLYDIGCNILDAFNHIYECTGEYNPNSIFEAGNTKPTADNPLKNLKASDILGLFETDTDEHKANRIKLARLVYGSNGEPFTLNSMGDDPWKIELSNDGDNAADIDVDNKTIKINAKLSAYTKTAANFLNKAKKDDTFNKTEQTFKSPFQKSIEKLGKVVDKAIKGQPVSREDLDKEVAEQAMPKNDKAQQQQQSQQQSKPQEQQDQSSANSQWGDDNQWDSNKTTTLVEPKQEPNTQNNQNKQPQQTQQAQQTQQENNEPRTQVEIYNALVKDYLSTCHQQIPADCEDHLNMSQDEVGELAQNYYGQICRKYPTVDGQTQDKMIKYIKADIYKYLRYANAQNGTQYNNGKKQPDDDGDGDEMVWYKDPKTKDGEGGSSSKGKSGKNSSWVQRQLDTSEVHRMAFTW